jgi:hypothetical protein
MISMHKRWFFIGLMIAILISMQGCKIYKFSDASVNPNIKTITINNVPNLAPIQVPSIAPEFVERLQNKFIRETNLTIVPENGDIEIDGVIVEYNIEPVAITQTETVAQNRLVIAIRIDFTNRVEKDKGFTATFRELEVYPANLSGSDVDNQIAPIIIDKLVQTIFNRAFVNW